MVVIVEVIKSRFFEGIIRAHLMNFYCSFMHNGIVFVMHESDAKSTLESCTSFKEDIVDAGRIKLTDETKKLFYEQYDYLKNLLTL